MPERLSTLAAIDAAVWQELLRAAGDKAHAWRTPVLATTDVGGDETLPDARTVVLREADAHRRQLLFYTDARSPKVAQLQARPRGVLVFWSTDLGWQLRCRVQLAAIVDGLAVSSRWAKIKLSPAAQDYLSPLAPGSPLDGAPPVDHAARGSFALLTAEVEGIDWLELHPLGHRRAIFGDGPARWVQT